MGPLLKAFLHLLLNQDTVQMRTGVSPMPFSLQPLLQQLHEA